MYVCSTCVLCSLLFERRVIVSSCRLSKMTSCVHAAAALLYPLYWFCYLLLVLSSLKPDYRHWRMTQLMWHLTLIFPIVAANLSTPFVVEKLALREWKLSTLCHYIFWHCQRNICHSSFVINDTPPVHLNINLRNTLRLF